MSDFNFDENTINKLKGMINNGELNDVISQIPPDMIKNFSSIMQNNSSVSNNENASNNSNFSNASENTRNKTNNSGFDFNNIDMNTIMKIKSIMEKMNDKNDPRSNLLNSLKPYLREGRKEKLDQYANLMKVANIAELLKNDDKEKNNNG